MVGQESARLNLDADPQLEERLAAAADIFEYAALGDTMPGFFTQYGYVKYLLENDLQMSGHLRPEDLRTSERVQQ